MSYVSYIAKRSLAPGHVLDAEYALPLKLTPNLKRSVKRLRELQESLSGKVETQFYGLVVVWAVELEPIALNEALLLIEFLDSTADGQSFDFDPYGSQTSPSAYLATVIRDDDGHDESRVLARGRGGVDDYVQYNFTVREA